MHPPAPAAPSRSRRSVAPVGLLAVAALLVGCGSDEVEVRVGDASARVEQTCRRLVTDLPATVADQERRPVRAPTGRAAAWGDPAIVLTCDEPGRPRGYRPESPCVSVDGVDWFIPDAQLKANGAEDLTMTTLFRGVTVRVELPSEHWPPATALADLSATVAEHTRATRRCL